MLKSNVNKEFFKIQENYFASKYCFLYKNVIFPGYFLNSRALSPSSFTNSLYSFLKIFSSPPFFNIKNEKFYHLARVAWAYEKYVRVLWILLANVFCDKRFKFRSLRNSVFVFFSFPFYDKLSAIFSWHESEICGKEIFISLY